MRSLIKQRIRRADSANKHFSCDLKYVHDSTNCPTGSILSRARPDFLLTKPQPKSSVDWQDVELIIEHSRSPSTTSMSAKFGQWLRSAWALFDAQKTRRFCFGLLFLQPDAFICYADHGCVALSAALNVKENQNHRECMVQFLASFLQSTDEERGREPDWDPQREVLRHDEIEATMPNNRPIYHMPKVVGRNVLVLDATHPTEGSVVCKCTWEEEPEESEESEDPSAGHPSEKRVIESLEEKDVHGLPQVFNVARAPVSSGRFWTAILPDSGEAYISKAHAAKLSKMRGTISANASSKTLLERIRGPPTSESHGQALASGATSGFIDRNPRRRRLYRFTMSKCEGLGPKIEREGFTELIPIIRDAMICYYEAYRIAGWLHGGGKAHRRDWNLALMITQISRIGILWRLHGILGLLDD